MLLVIRHLLVGVFCVAVLPSAIRLTFSVHPQQGVASEIPLSLVFASLPIGLLLMAWYALRLAVTSWQGRASP